MAALRGSQSKFFSWFVREIKKCTVNRLPSCGQRGACLDAVLSISPDSGVSLRRPISVAYGWIDVPELERSGEGMNQAGPPCVFVLSFCGSARLDEAICFYWSDDATSLSH
uniref:Uncharacterized protein n=1 Tax=Oryza brachyantha TaxID=4533 RepID=J3LCE8_ORYBR